MNRGEDSLSNHVYGNCPAVSDYEKISRIGRGTYGYVYKAINKSTGEPVALKRIILHHEQDDGFPLTSIREIKILQRCVSHKNVDKKQNDGSEFVVKLLDVVVGPKRDAVFMVFEYCEHDLYQLMTNFYQNEENKRQRKKLFRLSEVKTILFQLLSAVNFLHNRYIIHRDVKLQNLLYTNKGMLKLADFGLARTMSMGSKESDDLTQVVVTLPYRAPELLFQDKNYTNKVDIWSIGCCFMNLLIGYDNFLFGSSELQQIHEIFHIFGAVNDRIYPTINDLPVVVNQVIDLDHLQTKYVYNNLQHKLQEYDVDLEQDGLDLLEAMFTYYPPYRISAKGALRHRFFDSSPYMKSVDTMPVFPSLHREKVIQQESEEDNSTLFIDKKRKRDSHEGNK